VTTCRPWRARKQHRIHRHPQGVSRRADSVKYNLRIRRPGQQLALKHLSICSSACRRAGGGQSQCAARWEATEAE